jgi:N-acetylmuramoyl-L-alanine amidase
MLAKIVAAAARICPIPGHGTRAAIGREHEPIGPGSRVTKIKDPGGAPGEAEVVLAIARRTRTLLLRRGYRVAMTRDGPTFRGGDIERAHFCNRRRAALMLRSHADGSETGFLSNPAERRLLRSSAYQWRVSRGLTAGVARLL